MTTATEIKVGDRIRSFDFPERWRDVDGENACFIEGVVEAIGVTEGFRDCPRYKVRVTKSIFAGRDRTTEYTESRDCYAYPPVNGVPKFFGEGVTDGVEVIA